MVTDYRALIKVGADGAEVITVYKNIGDSAIQAGQRIKAANDVANSTAGKVAQGVSNAFGQVRKNLSNFSYQMQDIAVQLGSGQSPFVVLMQQGPQIASIFGPGGAVVGAVGAGLGLIAGHFLRSTEEAEKAEGAAYQFSDALQFLGDVARDTSTELGKLITKYQEASE